MLNIDAGQSVNPNPESQYGYVKVEETDTGYKFTPNDGVTPGRDTIYYDYVKITVNGEPQILPFNITKSDRGEIVIIGPDLSIY
jgi:hypothetical protein